MNYKDAFAINETPFNELIEENELESSKHQLNNFNFYEPKLVHDFYLKYFTNDILFKTDILELKDFLEFHYYYCDNPIKYYEILDFKVLPKVQEIIDNAQMSFGGGGYFNEEKLDYGFVESEGTIHNYDYEYFLMFHRTAAMKLQNDLRKRIKIIEEFVEEYKDVSQVKPLKWIAGPSQMGVIISELISKGYMEASKYRGEVNNSKLSRDLFKAFSIKDCNSSKSLEIYLSPGNEKNKITKTVFEDRGFTIPPADFT